MEPFPSWGEPERRTGKASGAGGAGRIEDYRRGSVMSDIMPSLSRRTFMKTTGALGALAAVGGSVAATNTLFGAGVPQSACRRRGDRHVGPLRHQLPGPLQPEVPRAG